MNYWFLYNLSDGSLYGSPYLGQADIWTNVPPDTAVLGPIDSAIASPSVQDAFYNPHYYTVQDGVLTPLSNIVDLQLTDAKTNKINQIQQSYNDVLTAGFSSSATGTLYHYAYEQLNQLKLMKLALDIASGNVLFPVPIPASDGTVIMHDQTQYTLFAKDVSSFEWTLQNKLHGIICPGGSISAATTVDQVNSISW
jgi:hypothetical protein